jgi:hypothetical protein
MTHSVISMASEQGLGSRVKMGLGAFTLSKAH